MKWLNRGVALGVALPSSFLLATSTAYAGSLADPVTVTNTETVQAQLDPSGKVEGARIYEQLSFTGKGTVKISNPVAADGLRNLDGFGGVSEKNGVMTVDTEVDGDERMRMVSDFDKKKLPIKVAVTYTLNGKKLRKPADAVGKSGRLEARYLVENTSAQPRTITIKDARGQNIAEENQVVIPMVGQLATVLPPEFTDVTSAEANKAGDGKGGTKLSFTVTLFPPVGAATAEFGWAAEVKDAVIPEAELTALPVSPLESPSFKSAVTGYESGAEKGADLVEGGTELDANLIKLRDGANKLLSGLLQLNAGAAELNKGLAEKAAPGANKLAAGASKLSKGLGDLESGAGTLRDKMAEADAGAAKLNKGAGELKTGAGKLADGAGKLKTGTGELKKGAGQLKKGAGDLENGAGDLSKGAGDLKKGAGDLKKGAGALKAGLDKADKGVGLLKKGSGELKNGAGKLKAGIGELSTGAGNLKKGTGALNDGLKQVNSKTPELIAGLGQIKGGLDKVEGGLVQMYGGIGTLPAQAKPLHDGIKQLQAGIGSTSNSATLLGGLEQLKGQLASAGVGIDKMIDGVYRDGDSKESSGAYQKIGCAVSVVKALNEGKAAGSFNNPQDRFCYGAQWQLLNTVGISAEPALSVVRKTVLKSLSDELAAGRNKLADPDNLTPDIDKPLPGDATLQLGLAYLQGRLTKRAVPGITQLQCGLSNVADSACDTSKPGLLQGLGALDAGVGQLVSGVVKNVQGGIGKDDDTPASGTLRGGVHGLQAGVGKIQAGGTTLMQGLLQLGVGAGQIDAGTGKIATGLGTADQGAGALAGGLDLLNGKVGELKDGTSQLNTGAGRLADGTSKLDAGAGKLADGSGRLADGAGKLNTGAGKIADGAGKLDAGAGELAAGTNRLKAGTGVLVDGTEKLDNGLTLLTGGAGKVADGAGKASTGSQQLSNGAGELATGIGTAAEGSGKIADGLKKASDSAPALGNGADRLSKEGAKKLVGKGEETAMDFGRRYAMLAASADRAKTESMPYGAPEGASGSTAYSLKLAGATGEGGRNFGRLIAALAVFGLALGATGLIRRRFA
ncbi:hypothetical protein [Kribbella deserti]|uniref:X-X-X-Leu-X-X-Gly heptad repeat protein n=1 Tax=Kribbella deserti TaxID=1926257 RepID=A0ABV6QKP2_9ACTN